jgi:GNAT superfamily N-acetyltransferase
MSQMPHFNPEGITFRSIPAAKVNQPEWRDLQKVERDALMASDSLDRSPAEIEHMIDWKRPDRFGKEHRYPMKAVERGRLRAGQLIVRPRTFVAYDDERPVGYAYRAKNTSGGSGIERWGKMVLPGLNYAWMREVAVDPKYQHRGIGHILGYLAIEKVTPGTPISAYVYQECVADVESAKNLGFKITGELPDSPEHPPFGPGSDPAPLFRMEAARRDVAGNILAFPGAREAIDYAHAHAA